MKICMLNRKTAPSHPCFLLLASFTETGVLAPQKRLGIFLCLSETEWLQRTQLPNTGICRFSMRKWCGCSLTQHYPPLHRASSFVVPHSFIWKIRQWWPYIWRKFLIWKIDPDPRWQRSKWKLHYPPRTNLKLQLSCTEIILNNQLNTSCRGALQPRIDRRKHFSTMWVEGSEQEMWKGWLVGLPWATALSTWGIFQWLRDSPEKCGI